MIDTDTITYKQKTINILNQVQQSLCINTEKHRKIVKYSKYSYYFICYKNRKTLFN